MRRRSLSERCLRPNLDVELRSSASRHSSHSHLAIDRKTLVVPHRVLAEAMRLFEGPVTSPSPVPGNGAGHFGAIELSGS
jgi:hypothetical protein